MGKSKNDIAWEEIFKKHSVLDRLADNGKVSISSTEIKKFREARLMTKFDHKSQLPRLFAAHNLSILPTSRGMYEIGRFETFCDFNKDEWNNLYNDKQTIYLEENNSSSINNFEFKYREINFFKSEIEILLKFIDRRFVESKNEEVKVTLLAIKSRLIDIKQKLKD